MPLPSPRVRLIIVIVLALTLVGWFLWWRTPAIQAPRTFALIQEAIASGSANGVLGQIHPDYDIPAHWPNAPWAELGSGAPRLLAHRALSGLFLIHRDNPLSLAVDLVSVTPDDDGRVTVVATLQLSSQQGTVPFSLGPIHRHRFVMARSGFTGRLTIIDHAAISFSR